MKKKELGSVKVQAFESRSFCCALIFVCKMLFLILFNFSWGYSIIALTLENIHYTVGQHLQKLPFTISLSTRTFVFWYPYHLMGVEEKNKSFIPFCVTQFQVWKFVKAVHENHNSFRRITFWILLLQLIFPFSGCIEIQASLISSASVHFNSMAVDQFRFCVEFS